MRDRVHELLLAARNRLARSGWVQHRMMGDHGEHCLLGALEWARGCLGWDFEPVCAAHTLIWARIGEPVAWNDAPGRVQSDVIALLDQLIALRVAETA